MTLNHDKIELLVRTNTISVRTFGTQTDKGIYYENIPNLETKGTQTDVRLACVKTVSIQTENSFFAANIWQPIEINLNKEISDDDDDDDDYDYVEDGNLNNYDETKITRDAIPLVENRTFDSKNISTGSYFSNELYNDTSENQVLNSLVEKQHYDGNARNTLITDLTCEKQTEIGIGQVNEDGELVQNFTRKEESHQVSESRDLKITSVSLSSAFQQIAQIGREVEIQSDDNEKLPQESDEPFIPSTSTTDQVLCSGLFYDKERHKNCEPKQEMNQICNQTEQLPIGTGAVKMDNSHDFSHSEDECYEVTKTKPVNKHDQTFYPVSEVPTGELCTSRCRDTEVNYKEKLESDQNEHGYIVSKASLKTGFAGDNNVLINTSIEKDIKNENTESKQFLTEEINESEIIEKAKAEFLNMKAVVRVGSNDDGSKNERNSIGSPYRTRFRSGAILTISNKGQPKVNYKTKSIIVKKNRDLVPIMKPRQISKTGVRKNNKKSLPDGLVNTNEGISESSTNSSTRLERNSEVPENPIGIGKTKNLVLKCHICKKFVSSKNGLNEHVKKHKEIKVYVCDICKEKYNDKANYKKHMSLHSKYRQSECPICHKPCKGAHNLAVHLRAHNNNKIFSCQHCGREYKVEAYFKNHLATHNIESGNNIDTSENKNDKQIYIETSDTKLAGITDKFENVEKGKYSSYRTRLKSGAIVIADKKDQSDASYKKKNIINKKNENSVSVTKQPQIVKPNIQRQKSLQYNVPLNDMKRTEEKNYGFCTVTQNETSEMFDSSLLVYSNDFVSNSEQSVELYDEMKEDGSDRMDSESSLIYILQDSWGVLDKVENAIQMENNINHSTNKSDVQEEEIHIVQSNFVVSENDQAKTVVSISSDHRYQSEDTSSNCGENVHFMDTHMQSDNDVQRNNGSVSVRATGSAALALDADIHNLKNDASCVRNNNGEKSKGTTDSDKNSTSKLFQEHVNESNKYECNVCGKKYNLKKGFFQHLKTHEDIWLQCMYCEKKYKTKYSLKKHEVRHTTPQEELLKYPCSECDKKFQDVGTVMSHFRMVHSKHRPYVCSVCDKQFVTSCNLVEHLRSHTGERPFQCRFCPKTVRSKETLKTHENSHRGIKPYVCGICGEKFVYRASLKRHKLSHKGIKLEQCDICGVQLATRTNLNMHMRIHTGYKPSECAICGRRFIVNSSLKKHMRSHTGEKLPPKHQCDLCGKMFITIYNMKIHRMIHTGEKPFACNFCRAKFRTQAFLNSHLKSHHSSSLDKSAANSITDNSNLNGPDISLFGNQLECELVQTDGEVPLECETENAVISIIEK